MAAELSPEDLDGFVRFIDALTLADYLKVLQLYSKDEAWPIKRPILISQVIAKNETNK